MGTDGHEDESGPEAGAGEPIAPGGPTHPTDPADPADPGVCPVCQCGRADPGGHRRAGWAGRLRRLPAPVRRLAPGVLLVALLAVPTGVIARGRMADPRPLSTASGGRGLFGELDRDVVVTDAEPVDIDEYLDPDLLEVVPAGPDDVAEPIRTVLEGAPVIDALDDSGIPEVAREAYDTAEADAATEDPGCGLSWSLLAAIGRVESDHGRFGGARLTENGYGTRKILGIPLDGRPNVALIRDTDGGRLDDDTTFDRAVGPMQIIPSTWRGIASDGNGDRRDDPNNIYDAAEGAAKYLCAGPDNLRQLGGRQRAVRRYNNADEYVRTVLNLATMYETGDIRIVESSIAEQADFDEDTLDVRPVPLPAPPPPANPAPAPTPAPGPAPTPPPASTTTAPTAPPPPPPAAAVGWAPAMREVVIGIITAPKPPPSTTTTIRPDAGAPTCTAPTGVGPATAGPTTTAPPATTAPKGPAASPTTSTTIARAAGAPTAPPCPPAKGPTTTRR